MGRWQDPVYRDSNHRDLLGKFLFRQYQHENAIPDETCTETNTARTISDNEIVIPDNNGKTDIIDAR